MTDDPPRSRSYPPGHDDDDPYDDIDTGRLPEWWQRNIKTFEQHQMRPYRPPTFEDGELVPDVVDSLESELGCRISLLKPGADDGDAWRILVDGETVGTTERTRTESGRSVYSITSTRFESLVRNTQSES
jgi:hypothetical protein